MKAIWKGSISFALISIPVKLYSAVKKRIIPLHLLHKKCSAPLKYERYCQRCNMDVEWEDVRLNRKEYELARELVRQFTGRFDASEFHDETRKALMELIETKIEGGEVRITPEKEVRKVISLMDALKRSLGEKPERRRVKRRVTK